MERLVPRGQSFILTLITLILLIGGCSKDAHEQDGSSVSQGSLRENSPLDADKQGEINLDAYPLRFVDSKQIGMLGRFLGIVCDFDYKFEWGDVASSEYNTEITIYFDVYVDRGWDSYVREVESQYGPQPLISRFLSERSEEQSRAILNKALGEMGRYFENVRIVNSSNDTLLLYGGIERMEMNRSQSNQYHYLGPTFTTGPFDFGAFAACSRTEIQQIEGVFRSHAMVLSKADFESLCEIAGGSFVSLYESKSEQQEILLGLTFHLHRDHYNIENITIELPDRDMKTLVYEVALSRESE